MLLINPWKGVIFILTDNLENIELSVGIGFNNFSMDRGSFNYKQKVTQKVKLIRSGRKEKDGSVILSFKEP